MRRQDNKALPRSPISPKADPRDITDKLKTELAVLASGFCTMFFIDTKPSQFF